MTAGWTHKRRPALPLSPLRDRVLFVHIFGELITSYIHSVALYLVSSLSSAEFQMLESMCQLSASHQSVHSKPKAAALNMTQGC